MKPLLIIVGLMLVFASVAIADIEQRVRAEGHRAGAQDQANEICRHVLGPPYTRGMLGADGFLEYCGREEPIL